MWSPPLIIYPPLDLVVVLGCFRMCVHTIAISSIFGYKWGGGEWRRPEKEVLVDGLRFQEHYWTQGELVCHVTTFPRLLSAPFWPIFGRLLCVFAQPF